MKFNEEAKQAFFDAFLKYRAAGETFVVAYHNARNDFTAAHKLAPNLWTFRKWYKEKVNGKEAEAAESAFKAVPDEDTEETAPEEDLEDTTQEEIPEEEADAAMSDDDYTKRLELICRMYRTHSEESRDALCDYLLPELCGTNEE
jgi:hypothetical protein